MIFFLNFVSCYEKIFKKGGERLPTHHYASVSVPST